MKKTASFIALLLAAAAAPYGVRAIFGLAYSLPYLDLVTGSRIWSISIYRGPDPFRLSPLTDADIPVLTANDVDDIPATMVADPFLARDGGRWFLFFEVIDSRSDQGDIAVASSSDGLSWNYERVVLNEPFHLSYPYVFSDGGEWFMIPESAEAGAVFLYRALDFPGGWVRDTVLIPRPLKDSSIIRHDGTWYIFARGSNKDLLLYTAPAPRGPWREHPKSPLIAGDDDITRPGGRMIHYRGRVIRFAQDGDPVYGNSVRVFIVDRLTPDEYREHESALSPVVRGTGHGWNQEGMHQVDAVETEPGRWLAAVDGYPRRTKTIVAGFGPGLRAPRLER